jgi:hypothetical protein
VEEAVLNPPPGHPHLCRFWRSPGQIQVSHFPCQPLVGPSFCLCPVSGLGWDPGATNQLLVSFLSLGLSQASLTLSLSQCWDLSVPIQSSLGGLHFSLSSVSHFLGCSCHNQGHRPEAQLSSFHMSGPAASLICQIKMVIRAGQEGCTCCFTSPRQGGQRCGPAAHCPRIGQVGP